MRRGDQDAVKQGRRRRGRAAHGGADVGRRLRGLRRGLGYSLRALAGESGLAVNTLSLIENGKVSPSVSTLQKVALTLGVPIAAFFETEPPNSDIVHMRADERRNVAFAHGFLEDLGAGMANRTIEPFLITLDPCTDTGATPIVHTGQEFVYCLEGRVDYVIDSQAYELEPGDSLLFEAHLPHRWLNSQTAPSKAILVLCPPGGQNRPAARHFGTGGAGRGPTGRSLVSRAGTRD
jgi:transcriptional regulator with XRE-family HTH domain